MDRLFQLTTKNLLGALNLVLVILCAYIAARIVHELRRPAPELLSGARVAAPVASPFSTPRTFDAYRPILQRNLFKAALEDTPPPSAESEVPEDVEESPLQAKLIATVVSTDEAKSTATIEDLTTRDRDVFRKDDTVMGEAKIVRIERERVIVLRHGTHEKLSLYDENGEPAGGSSPTPAPTVAGDVRGPSGFLRGIAPGAGTRRSDPRGLMGTVAGFNSGDNDFRIMPNFRQGRMDGIRVFAVSPDSKWAKSGLRNGDVVQSVNGREVSGSAELKGLLEELAGADDVVLNVRRGGAQQQIKLEGGS